MLIVFDWDGTLIDSTAKIVACMQRAADDCAVPVLEAATIRDIIGLGLPEAIQTLYPDVSFELREDIRNAYARSFLEADQIPCSFFPGVEECLSVLSDHGHQVALATGKSRKGLNRMLDKLGWQNRFVATRCADETASKPHPKMLLELMTELGFPCEETWMVGDTEYDLAMARSARTRSVGVSYGAHDPERLKKHDPVAIIDTLRDLPLIISN